jgi:predicted transcriptional regulator
MYGIFLPMKKSEIKREVFSTRIDSDLLKKVRHLAVDEKKPLNLLLEEAMELLLKKYLKVSK